MAKKKNTMIVCEKETTNKRKGLFPDLGARVPEISVTDITSHFKKRKEQIFPTIK